MKFLVFSDSHNRVTYLKKALDIHKALGSIDCIFHLGDGHKDLEMLTKDIPVLFVDGNYEEYAAGYLAKKDLVREVIIELGGFKFFLIHGHTYNVKSSLDYAIASAKRKNAHVLLYGHTHTRDNTYIPSDSEGAKGLYVFNPGSISRPRDYSYSYGVIETKGSNILLSHGTVI